jgi:hypothetical protein
MIDIEAIRKDPANQYWVNIVPTNQDLSLEFLEEFKEYIWWTGVCLFQRNLEEIIERFPEKVVWNYLSCNNNLDENCIRRFQDKVNWSCISVDKCLSKEFIMEFADKLNFYNLLFNNELISQEVKDYCRMFL